MCQSMCQFNEKIQFFTSFLDNEGKVVFNSKAAGETTINYLLESIKNPKPKLKELIDKIRTETNKTKRSELKTQLPGFIIQSYGTGKARDYKNIISFTGYTVLDFDGSKVKDNAEDLKQFIFDAFDFIVASYISPSGAVKCIMRVEVAESVEEYQDYYRAITETFEGFIGFDSTPKNAVLIMFYTYDPDIIIRTDASIWTKKLKAAPRPVPVPCAVNVLENVDLNTKRAYGLTASILDKIVDNGHPQLRGVAKVLGGYTAQYNLSISNAEHWIHSKIEMHPYLSKGISGYKKTASEFIKKGINEPLNLSD